MKIKSKIWLKKFTEEEFEDIKKVFFENTPCDKESWENKKLGKIISETYQFPHMESDIADNSMGIDPKQIKELKLQKGSEYLIVLDHVLKVLNLASKSKMLDNYIDEDGYLNWTFVWSTIEGLLNHTDGYVIGLGEYHFNLSLSYLTNVRLKAKKDVIIAFGEGRLGFEDLKLAVESKNIDISQNPVVCIESFDKDFLKKMYSAKWIEAGKRIPKSDHLLKVHPGNFEMKITKAIQKLFGEHSFIELKESDQIAAGKLIDNLGINLLHVDPLLLKKDEHLEYTGEVVPIYPAVAQKLIKVSNVASLNRILHACKNYPSLEGYILRKDAIEKSDLSFLNYVSNLIGQISEQEREIMKELSPDIIRMIQKNDPISQVRTSTLVKMASFFKKNKDNEMSIPVIKGKVGSYSYEILTKDNPEGLILGYATDCCQTFGGNGESCLKAGYTYKNSSFFSIKKKDKIYAQSWIWEKDLQNGKMFAFDSLEILGKNSNCSDDIIKCYIDAAKKLSEFYDLIIASADGSVLPDGISKIGDHKEAEFIDDNDLYTPFNREVYSDIDSSDVGVYLMYQSKKIELNDFQCDED